MELPLRFPPPGVNSNFTNPPSLGKPVFIVAGICLPLVLLFATARIYSRAFILKRWRIDDYVYTLSCLFGLAMFALSLYIAVTNGHHAWDLNKFDIPKSSMLSLLSFWIALGPMLWVLKLSLFCFVMSAFGYVRWLKNCAWAGIILTGLVFSTYTIVVTMTCGPTPNSDAQSYVKGLNRHRCSNQTGVHAIVSIVTSSVNAFSNVYLLLISYPLIPLLPFPRKEIRAAYFVFLAGTIACAFSFVSVFYRYKSWQSDDITGNQIPVYTTFILEAALTLMIPCMPSIWVLYRHFTLPDIDDTTTIATPNMKMLSSISSPLAESRATWRKTHDIEELPYRKASLKFKGPRDSRMKALPTTPLPVAAYWSPPRTPKTPTSMRLPIMFQTSCSDS